MDLTDNIKHRAIELGFDLVGITDALSIDIERIERFRTWLDSGMAGHMEYLNRDIEKRFNPAELVQNARSVIVVGLNFKPPEYTSIIPTGPNGKVVSYARYEDYHTFIRIKLLELAEFIKSTASEEMQYKIFVDSSILAERSLAVKAGLGFIGKNQMLINPQLGCQIFLGEIITDLKLQPDKPVEKNCSTCSLCIEVCPTQALRNDGRLDASKCINYLTIEYKGQIPTELAEKFNDRLFGCEECILVCPYQQKAPVCKNNQFKYYPDRAEINLQQIFSMNEELFNSKFSDSVIKRTGLERIKRNAQICLNNKKTGGKTAG